MAVQAVHLEADAFLVCLNHALSTEKEEVMGLCIGEVAGPGGAGPGCPRGRWVACGGHSGRRCCPGGARGLVPSERDSVTAAGSVARVCVVAVPRQSRATGPWAFPLLASAES